MKRSILTLLLIAVVSLAYSQSPGYRGRKFSLNYGFYFMNALNNPNYNGNCGLLNFNTTHCLAPEYVVGRRIALGVSVKYARSGFTYKKDLSYKSFDTHYSDFVSYELSVYDHRKSDRLCGTMEVLSAGIYPKIFFGNNIAPLGSYFKPELVVSFAYVQEAPTPEIQEHIISSYSTYYNNGYRDYPVPDIKNDSPYMTMGLGLEFGESRIFFNRLIVDYGVRAGLTFGSFMSRNNVFNESNYFEYSSGGRVFQLSLLNFKVGAGLLAF